MKLIFSLQILTQVNLFFHLKRNDNYNVYDRFTTHISDIN